MLCKNSQCVYFPSYICRADVKTKPPLMLNIYFVIVTDSFGGCFVTHLGCCSSFLIKITGAMIVIEQSHERGRKTFNTQCNVLYNISSSSSY